MKPNLYYYIFLLSFGFYGINSIDILSIGRFWDNFYFMNAKKSNFGLFGYFDSAGSIG
jgi:hypothetical protein